ncbi:hypothetical protein [Chryseobacterium sp. Leaf394]|uniref:hypothetical protein n=1 Tax=Chryseobacterium sp. Leaf394 TaxID=1736361 RepID=UPI0006F4E110|nr:hypothetical protein [Chryseobacterium sp. Leaf394]KQS90067.1 hypothetical protein ASG21_13970 [Chryseobacterium sp. Leaf394]
MLLDKGQKHTEYKNVFQVDKVYSASFRGEITTPDSTHQQQQKDAGIDTTEENKNDTDVIKTDNISNPSAAQQWEDRIDYKIESDKEITLKLRYLYNKTAFESLQGSNKTLNNAVNLFWVFRYFWFTDRIVQKYFLPISTCRYPNQIAKINVYPDIEWLISLKLSSTIPNVYSHTNMPSGPTYEHHQERAIEVGQNRRRLNKEVSFELVIKATTDSVERSIGIAYEDKIEFY